MQVLTLPLFEMAFFVYLARFVAPASSNIAFIAVGNAMQVASFSSIFAVCNLTSEEKWQGTLIPLIATPANRFPLFLGQRHIPDIQRNGLDRCGVHLCHIHLRRRHVAGQLSNTLPSHSNHITGHDRLRVNAWEYRPLHADGHDNRKHIPLHRATALRCQFPRYSPSHLAATGLLRHSHDIRNNGCEGSGSGLGDCATWTGAFAGNWGWCRKHTCRLLALQRV